MTASIDNKAVVGHLNKILELELAGAARYAHFALMMFGSNRIPIISWMCKQANESLAHAREVGELIAHLSESPSPAISPLLETHQYDMGEIMRESLKHEREALKTYQKLLTLVQGGSVLSEDHAYCMTAEEVMRRRGETDRVLQQTAVIAKSS